jgi:hypothetical protein
MFWFLSLQHQCDASVGFIFHKNLAGFFSPDEPSAGDVACTEVEGGLRGDF